MDAPPIGSRDETGEVRSPTYRVCFFDGGTADEFELDARDVVEALTWVEDHRGPRTYALYACVPTSRPGLVLLAGADPRGAASAATSQQAVVSKLVITAGAAAQITAAPRTTAAAQITAMAQVLDGALAPVLRDVRKTEAPEPGVDGYGWVDDPTVASAMLGGGTGLIIVVDVPEAYRIAAAADQVQEWVIEELWGSATTNWPPCPHHRASHPLRSVVLDGVATWVCPADGDSIAPVGSLPSAPRTT